MPLQTKHTYQGKSQRIDIMLKALKRAWKGARGEKFNQAYLVEEFWPLQEDYPEHVKSRIKGIDSSVLSKARKAYPNLSKERVEAIEQALELTLLKTIQFPSKELKKLLDEAPSDEDFLKKLGYNSNQQDSQLNFYPHFSKLNIEEVFEASEKEIIILDTFIHDVWIHYQQQILSLLEKSAQLKVKILLADPNSPILQYRMESLKGMGMNASNKENLLAIQNLAPQRIEVRLYDQLPAIAIWGGEKKFLMGWFWAEKSNIHAPWLEVSSQNIIGKNARNHFNSLWESSKAFSPDDYPDFNQEQDPKEILKQEKDLILNAHEATHFRCLYMRDGKLKHFGITYDLQRQRVLFSCTESRSNYIGTCTKRQNLVEIRAENEQKNRQSYIILETGPHLGIHERELSLGIVTYTRDTGSSHASRVIIQRIPSMPDSWELLDPQSVPKHIENYLNTGQIDLPNGARDIKKEKDLAKILQAKEAGSNKSQRFFQDWAGLYDYYAIHGVTHSLVRHTFEISKRGEIRINWGKETILAGLIDAKETPQIHIETFSPDRNKVFYNFLKIFNRSGTMKGVYIGSNVGDLQAGRIYVTPSEMGSLAKGLPEELDWNDNRIIKLTERHKDFLEFFAGEGEYFYLDDPASFKLDRHLERFPYSGDISNFVGTYIYHYTSVKEKKIGQFILDIDRNGWVKMKGTQKHKWEGAALYYGPHLIIRFFEKNHPRKFVGVSIFYGSSPEIKNMIGVSTLSRSSKPIGRKVVMIKTDAKYEDLKPTRFKIASKEFDLLNQKFPGLATSLINPYTNYLQVPQKDNFISYKSDNGLAKSLFQSACYLATQQRYAEAETEFRQALAVGFSDQEAFNAEIHKGALKPLKQRLEKWLTPKEGSLITYDGDKKSLD